MKEPRWVQMYTEDRAEDDAERALNPDARRVFERLEDAGLLEHTTQAERVRVAEAYAVHYALWRAALLTQPDQHPVEQVYEWKQDEGLNLTAGGYGVTDQGERFTEERVSNELRTLYSEGAALPEEAEDYGYDGLTNILCLMVLQLVPLIQARLDLAREIDTLGASQRERLIAVLRDRDLLQVIARTESSESLTWARLGAEIAARLIQKEPDQERE